MPPDTEKKLQIIFNNNIFMITVIKLFNNKHWKKNTSVSNHGIDEV